MKKHVISLFAMAAMSRYLRPQFVLDISAAQTENPDHNISGTKDSIYIIPAANITTFGTLQGTPTYANENLITAAHTLATGKKWIKVDLAENSGKFTFEGPKNRQGNFKQKFEGMIPSMDSTFVSMIQQIARQKVYALIPNRAGSTIYHIGADGLGATLNASGDTGAANDDSVGIKIEITCTVPSQHRWDTGNAISAY